MTEPAPAQPTSTSAEEIPPEALPAEPTPASAAEMPPEPVPSEPTPISAEEAPPEPAPSQETTPPQPPAPSKPEGWSTGPTFTIALAAAVGLATGLLAVVFLQVIQVVREFSYGPLLEPFGFLQPYVVVLVPALGGLLVGLIALGVPEVRGTGVTEVMAALAWPTRALWPILALARPVAAALTVGTGGSAGQEGPIVHGGAAIAAALATALGLSPARRRTLLACASAGAIAAVFDTPLAGLAFALEVILGGFSASSLGAGNLGSLGAVVVATVSAVAARRAIMGSVFTLAVSPATSKAPLVSAVDLLLVAMLGLVAGAVAVFFSWTLSVAEEMFSSWRLPAFVRPAVGGLAVGILAFLLPLEGTRSPLLGTGFETLEMALRGEVVWGTLILLVVLKVTTTVLTVGSGGSGDVFGPSLVVGGALGAAWGALAKLQLPYLAGAPGGYALAGMVAVFAGAAHAPVTAVLLGWELAGGNVQLLPALVIAALVARWVAGRLEPASIYTIGLERQGLRLRAGHDAAVLDSLTLADVLGTPEPVPAARTDDPFLAQAPVAHPTDTLAQALRLLDEADVDRLLVVDPDLPGRLLGIVRRADIEDAVSRQSAVASRQSSTIEGSGDV